VKTKDSPRIIAKTRKQIQRRQCKAPQLGDQLVQTVPIFIEDYWTIGLDIPVEGPGLIEIWADLDGNGRYDGYQERVVLGLDDDFEVQPGAWELVAVKEFDRYAQKVVIHEAGLWANVTPWKYLDLVLRLCPRRCFDHAKHSQLCKEYHYMMEMVTRQDPSMMMAPPHQPAAYGIPNEYLSHGSPIDTTVGIVSGILTSCALVGLFVAVGVFHYFNAATLKKDGLRNENSSSTSSSDDSSSPTPRPKLVNFTDNDY